MTDKDLIQKVKEMARLLDDEAIAQALKLTPEAVRGIIEGKAEVKLMNDNNNRVKDNSPIIQVNYVSTSYRQKIISMLRSKGGVGNTVLAINLAYALSKELRVLLIDLNFGEGVNDLFYYLGLPVFPNISYWNGNLQDCVLNIEPNFDIIQSSQTTFDGKIKIDQLLHAARQDYDAIVIDLPNHFESYIRETIEFSNTLIITTSGISSELMRLNSFLEPYQQRKNVIVAANMYYSINQIKKFFPENKIVQFNYDNSLVDVFINGDLPSEKSIFMQGIKQIVDCLFEREKKGILKSLFGG